MKYFERDYKKNKLRGKYSIHTAQNKYDINKKTSIFNEHFIIVSRKFDTNDLKSLTVNRGKELADYLKFRIQIKFRYVFC